MKAVLVYASGKTELRDDGGGQWWLHDGRYFWGWEVACDKTGRGGESAPGTVVYIEQPKSAYDRMKPLVHGNKP